MQKLQYEKAIIGLKKYTNFYHFLKSVSGIKAGILFGSVARGDNNYHSDMDIALWLNPSKEKEILQAIETFWASHQGGAYYIPRKQSIFILTESLQKIDVLLVKDLNELNRNYLGSNIPINRIEGSIIFDKTQKVAKHLKNLYHSDIQMINVYDTDYLINYFLFAFEGCSKHHAKSDGYKFYFNYNIAFHTLIQLQCKLKAYTQFLYSPKNVFYHAWDKERMEELYQLKGSLFLPDANQKKRLLLVEFYRVLAELTPTRLNNCKAVCEAIYNRDYFWNFRDYNIHIPNLTANKIFRSATLSLYKDEAKVINLLDKHNIQTIIDLRAPKEVKEIPHTKEILAKRTYIKAPFDPWNQPQWFEDKYHYGTNRAIAYRFFLIACQAHFKQVIKAIIETEGAVLIHCHAGKDRTGLVIGAIQLLMGCPKDRVIMDYMASGSDVDLKVFKILFEQVEERGGIQNFFEYQGIGHKEQMTLIQKLKTP